MSEDIVISSVQPEGKHRKRVISSPLNEKTLIPLLLCWIFCALFNDGWTIYRVYDDKYFIIAFILLTIGFYIYEWSQFYTGSFSFVFRPLISSILTGVFLPFIYFQFTPIIEVLNQKLDFSSPVSTEMTITDCHYSLWKEGKNEGTFRFSCEAIPFSGEFVMDRYAGIVGKKITIQLHKGFFGILWFSDYTVH